MNGAQLISAKFHRFSPDWASGDQLKELSAVRMSSMAAAIQFVRTAIEQVRTRGFWAGSNAIKMTSEIYEALTTGPLHSFRDVLHETLPLACIGVYTIWHGTEFMYVGIAGRNLDLGAEHKRIRGVRDRLDSHRSGRRSGDQFAVYVCDRLVLPTLSREQIKQVAAGELSLDALTRVYIHENLAYRFAATRSYEDALGIETVFARGETEFGFPRLNLRRPARIR